MSRKKELLLIKKELLHDIINNLEQVKQLISLEHEIELDQLLLKNEQLSKDVLACNKKIELEDRTTCLKLTDEAEELKKKILQLNEENMNVLRNTNQLQHNELKVMNQKVRASLVYNNMRRHT